LKLRDTYLEVIKVNRNTTKPIKVPKGVKNKKTPVEVATAFPPLKPAKIGNTCPDMASKPQIIGLTVEPNIWGSKQATVPFNKSAIATIAPAFFPKTLKVLVAPRFPLHYPRISVL
jgi:hypothetical protein